MARRIRDIIDRRIIILLFIRLLGGMLLSPRRMFFPIYLKELGLTVVAISFMATLMRVTDMAASLVGGSLTDALGRKRILLVGWLGIAAGCFVFLTPSYPLIAILWAVTGFGTGLYTLGSQSYLIDNADPKHLGVITALFFWGFTIGGTISSPGAGFLLIQWGFAHFGVVLLALSIGTITVCFFLLPRSRVQPTGDRITLKTVFGYGDLMRRPSLVLLALLRFLPTFYYGMTMIFLPLMFDAAGAGKMTIAIYATVSSVVAALSQIIVGRLADLIGRKRPTLTCYAILVIGILGLGLYPSHIGWLFAFGTLGTAAAWSLSTLFPSLIAEVTEPRERGRALGMMHLFWNLGMVLSSLTGGFLYEIWIGLPFMVSGGLNLFCFLFAAMFFRMTEKKAENAE